MNTVKCIGVAAVAVAAATVTIAAVLAKHEESTEFA